jgi:hypothetical protein
MAGLRRIPGATLHQSRKRAQGSDNGPIVPIEKPMRWLKNVISLLLLLAAVAVALATAFSDHSDDYGQVPLPPGGVVHLPEGKVVVYLSQLGDGADPTQQGSIPLGFQVVSVNGGVPVAASAGGGAQSPTAVQRSETVGELGAVAKLDVPSAGDYAVSGTTNLPAGSAFLKFGTNAGAAVVARWHLLAGLLIGAILIGLIPTPRPKRRRQDDSDAPAGWSSNPRAPYAG